MAAGRCVGRLRVGASVCVESVRAIVTAPCSYCGVVVPSTALGHACSAMQTPEPGPVPRCIVRDGRRYWLMLISDDTGDSLPPREGEYLDNYSHVVPTDAELGAAAGPWVACAERMPPDLQEVLVWVDPNHFTAWRDVDRWSGPDDMDHDAIVTHWAPIYAPVVDPVAP